jgi:nicotinamidase/pyrazinamidase
VQAIRGAEFHPALAVPHAGLVLRKGCRRTIDSYSAFFENDRRSPTGLSGYRRERSLSQVFICGLAMDFCVAYSAIDARGQGFHLTVIENARRAIDTEGSRDRAVAEMATARVRLVSDSEVWAVT